MALQIKGMSRTFKFKKGTEYVTLQDPNPNLSPDMVMSYYSNFYPELTTATVQLPVTTRQASLDKNLISQIK